MKNYLLLLAAASLGTVANAQEFAAMDTINVTSSLAEISAGFTFASSESVSMNAAYADSYKTVSLTADGDAVKALVIDGKAYDMPKGAQGNTNPSGILKAPQTSGAVYEFDVKADGYLYVFSKLTYSKNYYVWAGQTADAPMIAYSIVVFDKNGKKYAGSLPSGTGDDEGIFAAGGEVVAEGGDAFTSISWKRTYVKLDGKNKTTWEQYESDEAVKAEVDAYLAENNLTLCAKDAAGADKNLCTSIENAGQAIATAADIVAAAGGAEWTSDYANASGVIAFPVAADTKYYVNATGSKITCGGYVFIPGATELATIEGVAKAAIKNITIDDLDNDAPIYNLQGQRVGEGYKGVCIQNGKKFVVK